MTYQDPNAAPPPYTLEDADTVRELTDAMIDHLDQLRDVCSGVEESRAAEFRGYIKVIHERLIRIQALFPGYGDERG